MKMLVEMLIAFLFPPRTESGFFIHWKLNDFRERLQKGLFSENWVALFSYQDENVRKLIRSFKYEKINSIGEYVAELLSEEILNLYVDDVFSPTKQILLIPIPLSRKRLKERGFNQVGWITQKVAQKLDTSFVYRGDILIKTKETKKQSTLARSQRLYNPKGAFDVAKNIKGAHIILIDDVITTGATIHEARKVLKRAGANKIEIFCIAH